MMEWFKSGGFSMFLVLITGAASIGYGAVTSQKPTKERLATLRSLPALTIALAVCSFGINLWAVNQHLSDDAFLKARSISEAQLPFIAALGFTESAQVLTLGGLLAAIALGLRAVAEGKLARQSA